MHTPLSLHRQGAPNHLRCTGDAAECLAMKRHLEGIGRERSARASVPAVGEVGCAFLRAAHVRIPNT